MPLNGSQSPDMIDFKQLSADVSKAVSYACCFYGHQTNWHEIEDITQDILLKLIEKKRRRLLSFAGRSKFGTWLYTVVRRIVRPYLLKQWWEKENLSNVDDLSPEALKYEANQEEGLIGEDERETLRAIISRLPERKRLLIELELQELKTGEIAKEMGIKTDSVYSEKSTLHKEIRVLLEGR